MQHSRSHIVWLLVPLICVLFLTGCWSRVEINDRAFITSMYIDRSENGEYEVTVGFPLPHRMAYGGGQSLSSSSSGNPYTTITKTGESIPIGIRKIRSDLTREISWGHCRIVVIGKKMAQYGIDPILEFAVREPSFHTKSYVMVAPKKAKDIAELTPVFERFPSEVLREFAKRRVILDTNIKDFLEAKETGGDMVASQLTVGKVKMVSEKGKSSMWVGTNGGILFKDGKMAGTIDVKEMRAALWIKGKMKSSMVSLKSPTDGKMISFIILTSKSSIHPVVQGKQIRFNVRIEAEDDILASESNIDLDDPKEINRIQDMLSRQVKGRIVHTIRKTQGLEVDAFGFGQYLNWR